MTQIIDFTKICNFKGIINYDFDFIDEAGDLEKLSAAIQMINASFLHNGFQRMGNFQYKRFMSYMKLNPAINTGNYIVL